MTTKTLPKGTTKTIDCTFQESTAKSTVAHLKDFGIRASYEQRSTTIDGEPYVEHSYVIQVTYVHIDELNCAKRILCLP